LTQNQSFPNLSKLLGHLRSGLKQFGLSEIEDLLRGRNDRDFNKKISRKAPLLQNAIREIQNRCIDLTYTPDPGQIKFLIWQSLSKRYWDADNLGQHIVRQLRAPDQERLVCIPLYGSVAPWRAEPRLHHLSHGVWLIEPCRSVDRMIFNLTTLLGDLPTEIAAELTHIEEPLESEFAALLSIPLLACRTRGLFSRRERDLWLSAVPLITLFNIVDVNNLSTSDDLALLYYMMKLSPPAWREELREEWKSATDDPTAVENGLIEPHDIVWSAETSPKVWSYAFHLTDGRISPVQWSSELLAKRPFLLILPSVLDQSNTNRLIEYGVQLSQAPATDLDRRLAHAVRIWTKAVGYMQEWDWKGGFAEGDWVPDLIDVDSLVLYSTIVLESLFSSESNKQEVTTRIAELTAGLLGTSEADRFELSKRIRKAYGLRSGFVHGSIDRPARYSNDAAWLFKIATLALWEVVRLRTVLHPPFSDWKKFENFVERRKFGN
jgi:hypothetical protein